MIGIYQDNFIDYLRDNLGVGPKITSKNIIVPCPYCEFGKDKDHYHLYISLEAPIFHCFHGGCEVGGVLAKFLKKLSGHDNSDTFVDKTKAKEVKVGKAFKDKTGTKLRLPKMKIAQFPLKELYLKKRLKFANILSIKIKGLIYDVHEFINMNQILVDETLFRLRDYLHNNFIGFVTENESTVMFRNIDNSHSMKFFKLKIQWQPFLDYYRLIGNNPNSSKIVLAEGIFDIFSEHIFDNLNIKDDVKLYASALSSKYIALIQSIVFHEQIFRPDVIILSDKGIDKNYYSKMKYYNKHIINSLSVYYNKTGKDFNDTPVTPVRVKI
ncbi:hypothetical protein KAR91_65080 [Candidatus Pacearchaeota archaeon]|nr:hypothetical protein [Candidatus Pacearchaeota archaeon]